MHQLWIILCLMWQGANGFMIYNTEESLCLQDSHSGSEVQLNTCHLDWESQQWTWREGQFLVNTATLRCLSALYTSPMQTMHCDGADYLQWQCVNHQLVSVNRSLELTADSGRPTLTKDGKAGKWKSLEDGDICQEKLRSSKQSDFDQPETPDAEGVHMEENMTEKQEFLRWFYRTEDSLPWTFAMLVLSFIALLLGCVLVVMSMMGNRTRKKIVKYRTVATTAAIVKLDSEELQVISKAKEATNLYPAVMHHSHPNSRIPLEGAGETEALKPGDIMVTWKDGSVSNLYPNCPEDEEVEN